MIAQPGSWETAWQETGVARHRYYLLAAILSRQTWYPDETCCTNVFCREEASLRLEIRTLKSLHHGLDREVGAECLLRGHNVAG